MSVDCKANGDRVDVVIVGGGLAGQALARQLLLETDKTILMLEKQHELPQQHQKVGESSVQLAGFYYGRVLELEEYLWRNQYMKYNLRFYWPSAGRDDSRFEEYGKSYIRSFSNIPSYQLNRNTFEGELLRRNLESERFTLRTSVEAIDETLADDGGPHTVRFTCAGGDLETVTADWLVDTSGRGKHVARRRGLARRNPIRHGAFFWWVEGLVDIDRLTDLSPREIRKKPERRHTGHLPSWLATNHFCAEGLWFWVIPLQGKTSLGLVFDRAVVDYQDVSTVEKATAWVCENFPCFARDLPHRKVLDWDGLASFSYDCAQTISPQRWALAGEAGRFSDPLYSPGSDLIAIYNTMIVDAIATADPQELESKCRLYEQMMRAVYQAYVPTYAVSYDALGDQEAFSLKYTWELTVYFAGYVFPFINDLFTDRRFLLAFMRLFAQLGPVNASVQAYLSAYFQWKKTARQPVTGPIYFDFTEIGALREAEKTFYEVGVSVDEAKAILSRQVDNLKTLARFIGAHVASVVLDDPRALTNRRFVEGLNIANLAFDPDAMRRRWQECSVGPPTEDRRDDGDLYPWPFDPFVLDRFRGPATQPAAADADGDALPAELVGAAG
jgi:flavin-dependent dehydrogenase